MPFVKRWMELEMMMMSQKNKEAKEFQDGFSHMKYICFFLMNWQKLTELPFRYCEDD